MGREKIVLWAYACDRHSEHHRMHSLLEVHKGEACNTRRGTVVHDQADADEVARVAGWTVHPKGLACPQCTAAQEATS